MADNITMLKDEDKYHLVRDMIKVLDTHETTLGAVIFTSEKDISVFNNACFMSELHKLIRKYESKDEITDKVRMESKHGCGTVSSELRNIIDIIKSYEIRTQSKMFPIEDYDLQLSKEICDKLETLASNVKEEM